MGKEGPGHELSYPSSLDLYLCRGRCCPDGAVCMRLYVCVFNQQCSAKQPKVSVSLAEHFDFTMEKCPRKDWLALCSSLSNHTMSQGRVCTMNCAFINNPHPGVTCTRSRLASHVSPSCDSTQQAASAYEGSRQPAAISWPSLVSQIWSCCASLGMISFRLGNQQ